MTSIEETSEFLEDVPLLEVGDSVLGGTAGPSNAQALVLAGRTRYLKDQQEALQLHVDGLTADDVDAEPEGAVSQHVGLPDPHTQYVLKTAANQPSGFVQLNASGELPVGITDDLDAQYVLKTSANLPNGYLQLDATGKLPAGVVQSLASRWVTAADQAERLALPVAADLTICTQVDDSTIYYLNATLDPSVAANWHKGQSTVTSGVTSFNNRAGNVTPENGDYNADQITESATREFVTPAQKQTWGQKQDKLVSGENLKSFKGVSLLGVGDFNPTPDELGCAAKSHTHLAAGITDFNKAAVSAVGVALIPGAGITIDYDSIMDRITIGSTESGGGGVNKSTVATRLGSVANQIHSIKIGGIVDFNLEATVLKKEAALLNQPKVLTDFTLVNQANWSTTPAVTFNGSLNFYRGEIKVLSDDAGYYKFRMLTDGIISVAPQNNVNMIPAMTSNTAPAGYVASASGSFSAEFSPWYAFDGRYVPATNGGDCWADSSTGISASTPRWLQIALPENTAISGYSIQNRGNNENPPKSWVVMGSTDGIIWSPVHTVVDTPAFGSGEVRTFTLPESSVRFNAYRIEISKVQDGAKNWVAIANFKLFYAPSKFLLNKDNDWFTVVGNALSQLPGPITGDYIRNNGISSITDLTLSNGAMDMVSADKGAIKFDYKAGPQIAMLATPIDGKSWELVSSSSPLSVSEINNGRTRVAITPDQLSYYVFNGSVWVSIGALTNDVASATTLMTNGMSAAAFAAITPAQWKLLFTGNSLGIFNIAIGMSINDRATDSVAVNSLTLNVNEVAAWKVQTPAEVEIRWYTNAVTFKTIAAGDYKFIYQTP